MYMMVESKIVDPLEVGGHVLAGYLTTMDLTDVEFDALKMCVAGRFAQVMKFRGIGPFDFFLGTFTPCECEDFFYFDV